MKVLQFVYRLAMMTAMLAGMFLAAVANAPVAVADYHYDFFPAIEQGDVEQVKHYINAGLDLDASFDDSWNGLQHATVRNRPEIVKMLLAAGANPNATGLDKRTALHLAIYNSNDSIAKILIAAGVKPDAVSDGEGETHLSFAKRVLAIQRHVSSGSAYYVSKIESLEQILSFMESHTSDSQYVATLRREHCEWLQDVRCEDDTPEETAAATTEEADYGVLYGSLAWRETPTHFHWYWVVNAADEGEANTDVGNYCDADVGNTTDCKLGGAFNNGCAAIAVGENDAVVIASGDSTFAARREATTFCKESGGVGCKAVDSVCTADIEDKEAVAKAKQEKETGSVAK